MPPLQNPHPRQPAPTVPLALLNNHLRKSSLEWDIDSRPPEVIEIQLKPPLFLRTKHIHVTTIQILIVKTKS